MLDSCTYKRTSRLRPFLALLVLSSLLMASACTAHQTVGVPKLLQPLEKAETGRLIAEVNRLATVKSLHGKLDIQFQDNSFATEGIAEKYRSADATITMQRPGKVYLVIQFLLVDIAQMTSDGEHFRVAVLKGDEKYRRFVKGTNNAQYEPLKGNGVNKKDKKKGAERETVNALSNLRPQHLTDALLIQPIGQPLESGLVYSQSEFYDEEPDKRPQAKSGTRVVRGYYLLEELLPSTSGVAKLKRRFWFDRVGGIRLARLQTFDDQGLLDTDVSYGEYKVLGENPSAQLPGHIELTRPRDQYKLNLTYQDPIAVTIDRGWDSAVFVLENKWGLPEVDLDARKDPRATTTP